MSEHRELSFRRELPDYMTVSVDGVIEGVDDDIMARAPVRVVVELPADVADSLAHVLARSWQASCLFGNELGIGIDEQTLAEALFAAATISGYRCPEGGAHPPSTQPRFNAGLNS